MSRRTRLDKILARGFARLDDADLDGAELALAEARQIDPDDPDVIGLGGSIASLTGDVDAALAAFTRMAELIPDDAMPLINVGQVYLHSKDDPKTALVWADRGLELADDDEALTEGVLLRAECLVGLDRRADAREALGELASSVLDDFQLLPLAELWYDAEDVDRAIALAERATKVDELAADAYHALGFYQAERGAKAASASAWREARRLDLAAEPPPWSLSPEEFDRLAHAALEELPPRARELLGNTPILVEAVPSEELVDDGVDPRLLGLFSGPPLPEHSSVGGAPVLTTIHLFQRNLEAGAMDPEDLAAEIRITVLHETAHFFGLDEDEVDALGLG
jgi:predicted Zn-dependent protease with MMP-like domain